METMIESGVPSSTPHCEEDDVGRWRRELVAALRRRGHDPDLVDDLVQEALLRIWRSRTRMAEAAAPERWRRTVLFNCLRRHMGRGPGEEALVVEPRAASTLDPWRGLHVAEFLDRLRTAAQGLTPRQRMAVWVRYGRQCSVAETCRVLETTPERLKRLLHRARAGLRDRMSEDELRALLDSCSPC